MRNNRRASFGGRGVPAAIVCSRADSRSRRGRRSHLHAVILTWLFCPALLLAAAPLRVQVLPVSARARSLSPIPVQVTFQWDGTRILEGRLEMEFRSGNELLGRYRSAELALTSGEQRFRMLLPPCRAAYDPQVQVTMRFVTQRETIPLDPATLFVPIANECSLVIAVCDPRGTSSPRLFQIESSLRLERFSPEAQSVRQRGLASTTAHLLPEDLPTHPLAYCAYDLVLLAEGALGMLRERQLDALRRWVQAGGSLGVLPGGTLQPDHEEFLAKLREVGAATPAAGIGLYHSGLGRCALIERRLDVDSDLTTSAWRQTAAFLWKVRREQSAAIIETGQWKPATNAVPYQRVYESARMPGMLVDPEAQPTSAAAITPALVSLLMPRQVRLIPPSALALILGLFLVAIGPVDYFVLGWFRRRRYTWITFPLMTVGFTVATVLLANHYLGRRDQRRALIIVDVGQGGQVLREDRYELAFAGRSQIAKTDVRDGLWSPMAAAANNFDQGRYYYRGPGDDAALPDAGNAWVEGRVPTHFTVQRPLQQWRPQLNRFLTANARQILPDFDWSTPPGPRAAGEVAVRLAKAGLRNAGVWVLTQSSQEQSSSGPLLLSQPLLYGLCVRPPQGWLSVVSQVSPTGGSAFEDAAVFDASDPQQTLLVIVASQGDDIILYRRVYHERS